MPDGEALAGVLLPNGDVYSADDHTYYPGAVRVTGDDLEVSSPSPLIAEISINDLSEPTVSCLEQLGWGVRVVSGQGQEPVHGRTNWIFLRVVRENNEI